jgi:hypothetical protein
MGLQIKINVINMRPQIEFNWLGDGVPTEVV